MSNICMECCVLPTQHVCRNCNDYVCPQCCFKRGLDDISLMLCKKCQNLDNDKDVDMDHNNSPRYVLNIINMFC